MILVGSQRGGATQLAAHLSNVVDNDHVVLHDVRGFMSNDLHGAFHEAYAISKATRCKQFLFSLSLNPPKGQNVALSTFVEAADQVEEKLGLTGQPRAIVIHEKNGRRHAHVVWSRIDPVEMKAVHLPYFKTKLAALSKELYLENGWELPDGHKTNGWKNPLNFTLAEWQQAKRIDLDPREIKQIFRECWMRSDGRKAFAAALAEHGYTLARGDRRGFVVVDIHGEVYSVARWTGIKTKDVRLKLGDPEQLPSVDEANTSISHSISSRLREHLRANRREQRSELAPLERERQQMVNEHRTERHELETALMNRWAQESRIRSDRLRTGIAGLWDKLTGKAAEIKDQNRLEAEQCARRDHKVRQDNFLIQNKDRKILQSRIDAVKRKYADQRAEFVRHVRNALDRAQAINKRQRSRSRSRGLSLG